VTVPVAPPSPPSAHRCQDLWCVRAHRRIPLLSTSPKLCCPSLCRVLCVGCVVLQANEPGVGPLTGAMIPEAILAHVPAAITSIGTRPLRHDPNESARLHKSRSSADCAAEVALSASARSNSCKHPGTPAETRSRPSCRSEMDTSVQRPGLGTPRMWQTGSWGRRVATMSSTAC
jgi:hypothetical protein